MRLCSRTLRATLANGLRVVGLLAAAGAGLGLASCGGSATGDDRTVSTTPDGGIVVSTPDAGTITKYSVQTGSFTVTGELETGALPFTTTITP